MCIRDSRKTLRTVVLIPYSIITVVSAFSWFYGFSVTTGYANHWLNSFTFGAFPADYNWFGGFWPSIAIICLSEIWKTTPFMSLLLLSGLAQVDSVMEEAAKVDGATSVSYTHLDVYKRQILPNSASDQRQQVLRRLAAADSSMDLMSLDPVFVAEFAEPGYLAPVPAQYEQTFVADAVNPIVESSRWKDKLVGAPMWANTQLLWYRKSVAQAAGLDMTKPVTWDQIIAAAQSQKKLIGVQARLYEGYMVWILSLIPI